MEPTPDRRQEDPLKLCGGTDCELIVILDRRIKEHTEQLANGQIRMDTLETMMVKNNADTGKVLEIVTMGENFFKVLGWFGEKLKTILALGGAVSAFVYWASHWGSKP